MIKQLELNLNKRLLIVEFDDMDHLENVISCNKQAIRFCTDDDQPTKLICKGSDLTEDVAKGLVEESKYMDIDGNSGYVDYKVYPDGLLLNPLESFISAIESNGWFWGDNPEGKSRPNFNDYSSLISYQGDCRDWDLSESRTFNPSKCIIFEIV